MADREFIEATAGVLGFKIHVDLDVLYVSRKFGGEKIFWYQFQNGGLRRLTDDQFLAWIKKVIDEAGPTV